MVRDLNSFTENEISLSAERVQLRRMNENDLDLRVKWFNDHDVNQTLILREKLEIEKTRQWFQKSRANRHRIDFIIEEKEQKQPVGCIGLREISTVNQSACFYIVIGQKQFWGLGIGKESSFILFDWAFNSLELNKIWSNVASYNTASLALLKKLGFQQEGYLREEEVVNGTKIDVVRFGLLASEFKSNRGK